MVEESIKHVKIYFRHISYMFTKCRTKWPPKHKIPNIFFNIEARIIILVSTYRFWVTRNSKKLVKNDFKAHRLHKMADKMADEAKATTLNVREMHLLVAEFKIHR